MQNSNHMYCIAILVWGTNASLNSLWLWFIFSVILITILHNSNQNWCVFSFKWFPNHVTYFLIFKNFISIFFKEIRKISIRSCKNWSATSFNGFQNQFTYFIIYMSVFKSLFLSEKLWMPSVTPWPTSLSASCCNQSASRYFILRDRP